MKKLLKNILFLVISCFLFNSEIHAQSIESEIKISEEDLTQLFKNKSWQFQTGSYQFDCSSYSAFSEKAQVIVSGKKVFPVEDLLSHQRSHQCQVIDSNEKKSIYGKAIFSIWNTNTSQKVFGYLILGHQSFIIPDFTDLNQNVSFKKDNTQRSINKTHSQLTKEQPLEKRQDAPLRKINIDVETTAGFLENFKSDFDADYSMAQHKALYVINNYNLMASLISVRDLNLAIKISRIYLYENEDPWVGYSRKRISLDVQTYWNGNGWVFSDSISPEMDIDEELPEQLYDNEYPINFVEQDNRLGAGEKIDRFRDGHIAIVEILTHLSNDGVVNQNIWSLIENPEISTGAYFVVGAKKYNHSNFYHYYELDLDEALSSLTIQNLSNLIMHEIGHNFGFSHTHARGLDNCECPNNPDIEDECENFQQNLEEIGTLMSYCHLIDTRYDEESIKLFQNKLNNADPVNRDIYLPVANNQNPVITLVQTSYLRDDRSFTLTVNAQDPNRERLVFKYELSSGKVIYSFSSILNEQFVENAEEYWVRITVLDSHGGSVSRVQNLLKLNPDNVELLVKNDQNELINPQAIPLGEEVRLVLKFRNIFNYPVNCQLTMNEEVLSNNSINRNGWSECVFPYQFIIPAPVSLTSQLTVDGYYPSSYQHELTVIDSANSINQAPVIRRVVFQQNGNPLILDNHPIEGLTTDQEYGFSILIFDREGDNVECTFDTGDGVQTIVQSVAIGNDPRERICLLFNYQFQRAGQLRMQFSVYDHKKLVVENRAFGFGFRYEKNLDALHGIRWFNAEVELVNINQTPYIYRVAPGQVIINAPQIINRLDAEIWNGYNDREINFIVSIKPDIIDFTINCELRITDPQGNITFVSEPSVINHENSRVICSPSYHFQVAGIYQIQITIKDQNNRTINPIVMNYNGDENPEFPAGVFRKTMSILPPFVRLPLPIPFN